jgi:hypothetical protein
VRNPAAYRPGLAKALNNLGLVYGAAVSSMLKLPWAGVAIIRAQVAPGHHRPAAPPTLDLGLLAAAAARRRRGRHGRRHALPRLARGDQAYSGKAKTATEAGTKEAAGGCGSLIRPRRSSRAREDLQAVGLSALACSPPSVASGGT